MQESGQEKTRVVNLAEKREMLAETVKELLARSVLGVARYRLLWLLVCLLGTLLAGVMIDVFQAQLDSLAVLLVFVPAIMAMGGNTGIQTSMVTVRNLATGQMAQSSIVSTITHELTTAVIMGLVLGLLVFVVAHFWTVETVLGACVGVAMLAAILFSAALGLLVPLFFRSIGLDPAVASGPLITTLNDVFSLAIYFAIARISLDVLF